MNPQSPRSPRLRPAPAGSPRAVWRVAAVLALWCCALAMQTIGLMHAHAHAHRPIGGAPAHDHAHARAHAQAQAHDHSQGSEGGHPTTEVESPAADAQRLLQALFGGHEADSDACHLFDQLTHADLIQAVLPAVPAAVAPCHPNAVHAAWHHATQSVGFLARGPPAG